MVENLKIELRQAKEDYEDELDCLRAEYEELQRENEYYKKQEQAKLEEAEKAMSANILDKLQETVKNAMYKTKYEDLERRYGLQEQQFEKRMKEIHESLSKAESQLIMLSEQWAEQNATIEKLQAGEMNKDDDGEPKTLTKIQIETREVQIPIDKVIIEASDKARITVLNRERELIKERFSKIYKKQVQELEANILAYQDLVITKQVQLDELEKELAGREDATQLKVTIA